MKPFVTIEDLMSRDYPEQTWLVDRLIPASAITVMSGPPASCKTWMLLDIALRVGRGEPVFGKFASNKAKVLIIDEESGERLLQKRLFSIQATADAPIYFHICQGFALSEGNVKQLVSECRIKDIEFVIIDSLVRVHDSDENSAGDMAAVFKHLRRIAESGITVLITHHNRKSNGNGGGNDMRGSSDILAALDCHVTVTRNGKLLTLQQTKNRYSEELEAVEILVHSDEEHFAFTFQGQTATTETALRDAIYAQLRDHRRLSQKELLSYLLKSGRSINEHRLRTLLHSMIAEDSIVLTHGRGKTKYYSRSEEDGNEKA